MVMSSWILGWLSGYPVMPIRPNGRPIASSRSSSGSAPSNGPAGCVASPPGTNTSSTPHAVSRATISSRCAWLVTERAARCGTTRYPRAASVSASPTVGSRPLTGDAVIATVIPAGTQSATACSVPLAGITSYRGADSSSRRLLMVRRHQTGERLLQPGYPDVDPGQRQAEPPRHPVRLGRQRRRRLLGQPDQPGVVPEVVVPQLRVPVQAEPGQHGPVEAAQQEVGEHVGAGLGVEHGRDPVRAAEHVVAVQPGQAVHAVPGA